MIILTKLDINLESKTLLIFNVVSIINNNYKIVSKLVSKLAIKVLATNILDFKSISKILIKTNLEYE